MRRKPVISYIAVTALALLAAAPAARAQDGSPWVSDLHSAVRLIGGAALKTEGVTVRRAGIEIRLDDGWKTYWRYPGDSGIPASFDFNGSVNVKSVTVLWPAPKRFADGAGGYSIGYTGRLIVPLRVAPQDAGKPTSLRVKAGYAVCEKLCMPAEAEAAIVLSGKAGAHEADLAAAEARVPKPATLGAPGAFAIRSMQREGSGEDARVIVEVAAPNGARVDLFAEGPTPHWALPLPQETGGAPGLRRFSFKLDGLPPGEDGRGARLTLTAVASDAAIEVAAHLD
jgi:DsbC/DsbD-like thiol-disulfide interchange protein